MTKYEIKEKRDENRYNDDVCCFVIETQHGFGIFTRRALANLFTNMQNDIKNIISFHDFEEAVKYVVDKYGNCCKMSDYDSVAINKLYEYHGSGLYCFLCAEGVIAISRKFYFLEENGFDEFEHIIFDSFEAAQQQVEEYLIDFYELEVECLPFIIPPETVVCLDDLEEVIATLEDEIGDFDEIE